MAVIVTGVFTDTLEVGMVKGAEKLPAGMRTDEGGVAAGELLESVTRAPPAGAWPLSIMFPPDKDPPLAEEGMDTEAREGGSTLNCAVAVPPLSVAVSVTGVGPVTWPAVMRNCVRAAEPGI